MRLLKKHVLLRLVNSYIVDSPQPANISYMWNFGSLLATCLIIQILTGIFLAMHYCPNIDLAFNSIEHSTIDLGINNLTHGVGEISLTDLGLYSMNLNSFFFPNLTF